MGEYFINTNGEKMEKEQKKKVYYAKTLALPYHILKHVYAPINSKHLVYTK